MESTLVGWKENTVVALVGRPWGSIEARVGINASLPLGLSLTPQERGARLKGLQDIQVGVPDLDARFQVQCENPAAAIRYMRDERTQRALRALLAVDPKASVIGGEVRLSVPRLSDEELLQRQVRSALRCAWALSEAAGGSPQSPGGSEALQALSPQEPPQLATFSPEYVHSARRKYQRQRVGIWCANGLIAALVLLPVSLSLGLEPGPLAPVARFLLEWDLVFFLAVGGGLLLRALLYRCPACSSMLPDVEVQASDLAALWRRRRVKCENCGIRLQ
jgi:hypothetical protein